MTKVKMTRTTRIIRQTTIQAAPKNLGNTNGDDGDDVDPIPPTPDPEPNPEPEGPEVIPQSRN